MRIVILLVAALALGSCSLPPKILKAVARDGRIMFEVYDTGTWPFGGKKIKDFAPDNFRVLHDNDVMWEIERRADPACAGKAAFPLTYSIVPACFAQKVRPRELRAGVLYRIESGFGPTYSDRGEGFFKLGLTPVNYDWSDMDGELQTWERYKPRSVDANGYVILDNTTDANAM